LNLFAKHKLSAAFLVVYTLWWLFIIFYYLFRSEQPEHDYSGLIFTLISVIIAIFYSAAFLVKYLTTNDVLKTDYLVFIGFVSIPLVIGGFWIMSNS